MDCFREYEYPDYGGGQGLRPVGWARVQSEKPGKSTGNWAKILIWCILIAFFAELSQYLDCK
jgi:hypothetical protein